MKMRKTLLIILGVVIIAGIGIGIWALFQKAAVTKEQVTMRNINVQKLANENETKIGTIIYAGAKMLSEVKEENNNQKVNLETTDSIDGAFNIYYQDLLNRYKDYPVSKKTITKDDALDKKAKVIIVSGQTGKITVTAWPKTNGMTEIEIITSKDFK